MIEIDTIQDIRKIENKIIGGFTGRQLISISVGIIIDIILFFTTHSIPLIMLISFMILILGFFKKNNLTAIEYFKFFIDKKRQPIVRSYKNKNVINEIEKQCKIYKSQKKKSIQINKKEMPTIIIQSTNYLRNNKKKIIKNMVITLIFCSFPIIVQASEIDTNIPGYTGLLNTMKVYVKGAGSIILMIGSADFFISLSNQNTDRLVRAMQIMGAGFFLILADNFVQTIGNASGSEAFEILIQMVGLIIIFIGAVLTMLGAYNCVNSIKAQSPEDRNRAIKLLFCGLMLIAIKASLFLV
ncbi:TPA: PrgI family protein [Clostridium botulinum]|nr:PrgI family protein [Clostridium botulinum]